MSRYHDTGDGGRCREDIQTENSLSVPLQRHGYLEGRGLLKDTKEVEVRIRRCNGNS